MERPCPYYTILGLCAESTHITATVLQIDLLQQRPLKVDQYAAVDTPAVQHIYRIGRKLAPMALFGVEELAFFDALRTAYAVVVAVAYV